MKASVRTATPVRESAIRAPAPFWRPELDVLRFLAFAGVFVHHAFPQTPERYLAEGFSQTASVWLASAVRAGGFGVDLFFSLSAYLITVLLLVEIRSKGAIDIGSFWIRRLLRIWPLYFVALVLTKTIVPLILPGDNLSSAHLLAYLAFAGNWSMAILGFPQSVASPLWSISIEEQFYLAWPLLLTPARNQQVRLCAALLLLASVCRLILVTTGTPHPGIWGNTFARLDPIAGGALVAILLGRNGSRPRLLSSVVLGVGALLSLVVVARFGDFAGTGTLISYPAVALCVTACLVAALGMGAGWLDNWPGQACGWLGKVSYGLYVFHVFALALSDRLETEGVGGVALRKTLAFATTVLLAAISYRYLELPFLKLKSRFSPAPPLARTVA